MGAPPFGHSYSIFKVARILDVPVGERGASWVLVRVVGLEPTSPGWRPGILGQLDEARLWWLRYFMEPLPGVEPDRPRYEGGCSPRTRGRCFLFWRAAEVSILAQLDLESNLDAGPQPELK